MAPVSGSIEIDRPPAEVFEYVAAADRRGEWQDAVRNVQVQTPEVVGVGMEVLETRQVPGGTRTFRWRVSQYDPPTDWGFRGIDNPLNAFVHMRFTPTDKGTGTTVAFQIDFQGTGLARLLAPLARRGARREVPHDLVKLKRKLEER
jgi:uncharacterized protein YndB with AHSA1/START domain